MSLTNTHRDDAYDRDDDDDEEEEDVEDGYEDGDTCPHAAYLGQGLGSQHQHRAAAGNASSSSSSSLYGPSSNNSNNNNNNSNSGMTDNDAHTSAHPHHHGVPGDRRVPRLDCPLLASPSATSLDPMTLTSPSPSSQSFRSQSKTTAPSPSSSSSSTSSAWGGYACAVLHRRCRLRRPKVPSMPIIATGIPILTYSNPSTLLLSLISTLTLPSYPLLPYICCFLGQQHCARDPAAARPREGVLLLVVRTTLTCSLFSSH